MQAHSHKDIGVAWFRAIILQWGGMSLAEVRKMDQELLPAFLAKQYREVRVMTPFTLNLP
jgi:hypothetical protein